MNTLPTGHVIERYTVEGKIGEGGVATVYRVRHNALGSVHALKVVHITTPSVKERLVQEGRVQASLRHPNVVAVTDVVELPSGPGLVMEYIDGPSLHEWMARPPSLEAAEAVFRGVLSGVTKAHSLGLVHRDLKPGNVLMQPSGGAGLPIPKVADFGLAKVLYTTDSLSRTRSGSTMGTPEYMAPEQVRDAKSVDERADIFALGCILYELCTGTSPFRREDVFTIFAALSSGTFPPLSEMAPELPARLRNAIEGSLAVDRDHRIGSCGMLLRVLDGEVTSEWTAYEPQSVVSTESPTAPRLPEGAASTLPEQVATPAASVLPWLALAGGGVLAMVGTALVVLALVLASPWGVGEREVTVVAPPRAPAPQPVRVEPPPATVIPEVAPEVVEPAEAGPPEAQPPTIPEVAPTAPSTSVTVTGEVDEVWLMGAQGRLELGAVAPGEYTVWAIFDGGEPVEASRRFVVREGQPVELTCSPAFSICRPR